MFKNIRLIMIFVVTLFINTSVSFAQVSVVGSTPACKHFPGPETKLVNGALFVKGCAGYEPFMIKGVNYLPAPIGWSIEWGYSDANDPRKDNILDDEAILKRDFELIKQMGGNTIRLIKADSTLVNQFPLQASKKTLDLAQKYGLKVVAGFEMPSPGFYFCSGANPIFSQENDFTNPVVQTAVKNRFTTFIQTFKDHPAILMWAIGNEQNVNLPNAQQKQAYYSLVNQLGQIAKQIEGANAHPVAVVEAEISNLGVGANGTNDNQLSNIDIWGVNVYRGISFTNLFTAYNQKTNKPLWISEFGTDAFHAPNVENPGKGYEDKATQALWVGKLWDEIELAYGTNDTLGGTVFAYSDEWWKPYQWICGDSSKVCNSEQNHFGVGPTYACDQTTLLFTPAMPDHFLHEEWWGLMSVSRHPTDPYGLDVMTPRDVYFTLKEKWTN